MPTFDQLLTEALEDELPLADKFGGDLQTHDPLGREFSEPQPGGPMSGMTNLIVGATSATGEILVSIQDDEESTEFGLEDEASERTIYKKLAKLFRMMTPSEADVPYYDWYVAFVTDKSVAEVEAICRDLLASLGPGDSF